MLSGREVSLQSPTVVSHHDCVSATLIPGLPFLSFPDRISPPALHSLNSDSQESCTYVKKSSAAWFSLLPKIFFITRTNAFQTSSYISFIEFSNLGSKLSLICNCGKSIVCLSTRESLMTFLLLQGISFFCTVSFSSFNTEHDP